MINLTTNELAARCLHAAADLSNESDPAELALIALTIATRIDPDRADDVAHDIHNLLDPITDSHDESDCAICILAADAIR